MKHRYGARLALSILAVAAPAVVSASFRTTAFNANLRINANRTISVDETIDIVPTDTGAITGLVVAEPPPGSHKIQYLINRATLGTKQFSQVAVKPDANGNLTIALPAGALKGPTELHINYSALGAFSDKSGGSLGARSTLSWDLIPTSWPSKIESGTMEINYPAGVVPVYTGANSSANGSRVAIQKTPNTAFSGSVSAFNVSEVRDGITMQPSAIAAKAGIHLLIAIARKDLKAAPSKLSQAPAKPQPAPASKPKNTQPKPTQPQSSVSPRPQPPLHVPKWAVVLPLLVPIAFFFAFGRRLRFMSGHGFATSAVPEGIGPAEAGYLLDGALKVRHVIGAVTAVVGGHYSQPDSATIDPADMGPVERRAVEILKKRTEAGDAKDVQTFLNGSLQDLQSILKQNLVSLNLLDTPSQLSRFGPVAGAVILLAATGALAVLSDQVVGGTITALALAATGFLVFSLSSLTQRGVKTKLKVIGLHRFLSAHSQDFKSGTPPDYLENLKPFAVAFGLAKEDGA